MNKAQQAEPLSMSMFATKADYDAALAQQAEPASADKLAWVAERLSYHQYERNDLTLDEALEYLRTGWARVMGRTERQLIFQICGLLAAPPADDYVPRAEYERLSALVTSQGIRLMDAEDDEAVRLLRETREVLDAFSHTFDWNNDGKQVCAAIDAYLEKVTPNDESLEACFEEPYRREP